MHLIRLRYGNTNTFLIPCKGGYLLLDTDCAGTLPAFYRAIKACGVRVRDIAYVLATHYHPDHMGLIPDLMEQGVRLLLADTQTDRVHFSDHIYARTPQLGFVPICEAEAAVIPCGKSRGFLADIGIPGEIVSTPSHSPDSISLILDDGVCLVGDLEPMEYLPAYEDNAALAKDWDTLLRFQPRRICYAHVNETFMKEQ